MKQEIKEKLDKLKERNHKITPQRTEIIKALNELKHPSIKEIKSHLEKKYPMISESTIYKTINLLKKTNEVLPIEGEDKSYFDINKNPHPHFICKKCGKIYDIQKKEIKEHIKNINQKTDLSYEWIELNFHGTCKKCQKK